MRPTTTLLLVLLLAIFAPAAQACKSKKAKGFIEFGNGGGFSGKYNDYKLNDIGMVYTFDDSILKKMAAEHDTSGKAKALKVLKIIEKKQTEELIKAAAALPTTDWTVNDPGNMTYYIRYTDAKGVHHQAKWGGTSTPPSAALKALYDKLILAIGKTNP